jgi:hypothetical protein
MLSKRSYNLLGLRLTFSRYDDPARPSGAQLAVYRSAWLTCGRFAYGWIEARPWPMLQNLQLSIFGMLIETECGAFPVLPEQRIEAMSEQLKHSIAEYIRVRIESRNATPARGVVRLLGRLEAARFLPYPTKLWGTQCNFHASPSCWMYLDRPRFGDAICTHVEYEVEPNAEIPTKWQRYRGRPEWEA